MITATIQYDTIEEFNVNSKAECVRLNLAHVAKKQKEDIKKKLKQTNASAHLVRYRSILLSDISHSTQ